MISFRSSEFYRAEKPKKGFENNSDTNVFITIQPFWKSLQSCLLNICFVDIWNVLKYWMTAKCL